MEIIISENSVDGIIKGMQDFFQKNGKIGGMEIVDKNDTQVVLLVDDQPVDKRVAQAFWLGWQRAIS